MEFWGKQSKSKGQKIFERCINCNQTNRKHHGNGLCSGCYKKELYKKRYVKPRYEWSRNHPQCIKCNTTKNRHYSHGLCERCYKKDWGRNNPLKLAGYRKKYRDTHKNQIQLHEQKPERKIKKQQYNIKNKTKRKVIFRGFNSTQGITARTIEKALVQTNGYCAHCGVLTDMALPSHHPDKTTFDHIIPVSKLNPKKHKFDPNSINNVVLSCWACNCKKRMRKTIKEWYNEIKKPIPMLITRKLKKLNIQLSLDKYTGGV